MGTSSNARQNDCFTQKSLINQTAQEIKHVPSYLDKLKVEDDKAVHCYRAADDELPATVKRQPFKPYREWLSHHLREAQLPNGPALIPEPMREAFYRVYRDMHMVGHAS